jgi:hypothetical protein
MAIKIAVQYPNAVPADADYPGGSFKNSTTAISTDGTPVDKVWANDMIGFGEAAMAEAGIVHSGAADKVGASDRLNALKAIFLGWVMQRIRIPVQAARRYRRVTMGMRTTVI